MKRLSKRDRRTLILGGGVAVGILVVFYGVLPYFDAAAAEEQELNVQVQVLQRAIREIQREDEYQARLATLNATLQELRERLIEAPDQPLARVQLESIVRDAAQQAGVTISQSSFVPSREQEGNYEKLTLNISTQSDLPEFTNFLYALAAHPKYILVEDLRVNSMQTRRIFRLTHQFKVSAYFRPTRPTG